MYKTKSGELIFQSKEEFHRYSKTCKKSVKCTGIRIHAAADFDVIFVLRRKMTKKLVEINFLIKESNVKKLEYLQTKDVEILDIMIKRLYEKFKE